ncbi:DUF1990 domain-containing protein [Streptomyces albiaxialis]|uniref:DUF1990 domain-containing protein n=1 Tax=Streptomyces albiaxialis TaxID=329523 RepID=A0ABN2VP50_9ACTN
MSGSEPPSASPPLTYGPVGATARGEVPPGFNGLCVRTRLGSGDAAFRTASRALMTWRLHHRMGGVRLAPVAPRAAEGVRVGVALGVGPLRVGGPCRVVWTAEGPDEAGWAYGTLPGHPVRGEEAFLVGRDPGGDVWLTVRAYSVPAAWWTRAAGPLVPVFQRAYARRCGRVLRRLVSEAGQNGQ